MSKKRMLTEAEMQRAHDVRMAIERTRYPDHEITITVRHATGDDGKPVSIVVKKLETTMAVGT